MAKFARHVNGDFDVDGARCAVRVYSSSPPFRLNSAILYWFQTPESYTQIMSRISMYLLKLTKS